MTRAFETLVDTPWAITEDYLRLMVAIAGRKLDADIEVDVPERFDPDAVSVDSGEHLEGTRRVFVRGGVAVVPVVGPLFRRANMFTRMSGASSVELLAQDFQQALDNPDVEAILLDVDSPGGQVNGISELSDLIFEARGRKPVKAFVSGTGASAAYWLASSASEVIAADTALLGSIGVRTAFLDTRERDRKNGVRRVEFVSSQSPNKSPDPTEEDGRAQIQRILDNTADVFIDAVARNRGVTRGLVLQDFGQGDVFIGEEAVRRDMADDVGTFEGVLAAMQKEIRAGQAQPGLVAATEQESPMADEKQDAGQDPIEDREMTAVELREAFPEAVSEIESEAAEAERERIQAIHTLDVPQAYEEIVVDGMFDPDADADSVSRAVLEAQSEKRKAQLKARQADEEELDAPDSRAGADDLDGEAAEASRIIAAGEKAGVIQRSA